MGQRALRENAGVYNDFFFCFFFVGGEKRPATSLTAQCSHEAELCLCSLTSRRRTQQTQTAEGLQLQERRGGHLLTESLAVVNNGWSDAQAFGSATESRAAQKTKNHKKEKNLANVYISAASIFTPIGKHAVFRPFGSECDNKQEDLKCPIRSEPQRTSACFALNIGLKAYTCVYGVHLKQRNFLAPVKMRLLFLNDRTHGYPAALQK